MIRNKLNNKVPLFVVIWKHVVPQFLLEKRPGHRGTQWIVSVNYLFGRPLIPDDFLKGIFPSNFRDVGNFGLIKMSFWVPKKGQLRFSERK